MNRILDAFAGMTAAEAWSWSFVENLALLALTVGVGQLLSWAYRARTVGPPPPPVEAREVALALSCVVGNTMVTMAGWWLWRAGHLTIRRDTGLRAWLDAGVLLLLMDLGMYVSHRLAHLPWAYPILHATHHGYVRPRPLDLFVLNPLEVFGFGALWLAVLRLYPSSRHGIVIFLTLNLAFGLIGHLGVEPFPRSWADRRALAPHRHEHLPRRPPPRPAGQLRLLHPDLGPPVRHPPPGLF